MHILQPKQTKLKPEEVAKLSKKFNIAVSQLPRVKADDAGLPEGCEQGDVIRIERKSGDRVREYFRVVV